MKQIEDIAWREHTYTDSKIIRVDFRVDSLHIGVGGNDTLFQGQDGFDESSKSTDPLKMTDIRFQSTPSPDISKQPFSYAALTAGLTHR